MACPDHEPESDRTARLRCGDCSRRFIYLGIGQSVVFLVLKVALGVSSGSRALAAAGLYSIQDLASSIIAAIGLKISVRPADKQHPYGHGKVEYLVVAFTSVMILLGIAAMSITSLAAVFEEGGPGEEPAMMALWVAVLSGLSCWVLARFQDCAAEKLNSPALESCAAQFHGDVVSSVAVVASVLCAKLGYPALDHIVAILEAVDVVASSGKVLATAIGGLMDSTVDEALLADLGQVVGEVATVRHLRARWSGQTLFAQVDVELSPRTTVLEADRIREAVAEAVRSKVCLRSETLVRVKPAPADAANPAGPESGRYRAAAVPVRPHITI